MHTMRKLSAIAAIVLCLSAVTVRAHEMTYKGTVLTVEPKAVKINVVDEKTKKLEAMAFEIDKDTKILRGDVLVTFTQAKIQKGEQIAVTVNLDDGGADYALVIRLAVKK